MTLFTLLTAGAVVLGSPPPRPVSPTVTVALVAALPVADAHAAVLRRANPRADVILLPQSRASADDLAAALALLADARGRDAVLVVRSSQLSRPLDPARRQRLEAHLARLRASPPRLVEGVGTVPAIAVGVKPPRL